MQPKTIRKANGSENPLAPGWLEFSPSARPRIGCDHSGRVGGRVTPARPNFIARSCRSDDKLHDHDLWQQFQGRPA